MRNMMELRSRPRKRAIDGASGKEWLAAVCESGSFDCLEKYFWTRSEWAAGYPLVHDYFVTYGAFDDFKPPREIAYALISPMAKFAESVPDAYFHMALSLLARLMPIDTILPRPAGFSDSLLRLRLRAEKLSFLPNLKCTWDGLMVAQRCLKSDDDPLAKYSPKELGLDRDCWPGLGLPLKNFTQRPFEDCGVDFGALRRAIQELGCTPGDRCLIFSTRIKTTSYWIWKLPGEKGTAHLHRIVFLRQPLHGECGLGYWDIYSQFHERATDMAISSRLLQIEFSVNRLIKLPRALDRVVSPD